jgi:hypothetical protein
MVWSNKNETREAIEREFSEFSNWRVWDGFKKEEEIPE